MIHRRIARSESLVKYLMFAVIYIKPKGDNSQRKFKREKKVIHIILNKMWIMWITFENSISCGGEK